MYKGRTITVIIPALNEAPAISKVVDDLFSLRVCPQCDLPAGDLEVGDKQIAENQSDEMLIGDEPKHKSPPAAKADGALRCGHDACQNTNNHTAMERLVDQIIVCDNGSTDDTAALAASCGAIVTHEPEQGYGAACLAALDVPVEKDVVVFVDGDGSVVATELPGLIDPLYSGADLVIGSRTLGSTERGALTIPQQFGNQLASFLIRTLWSSDVTDLGPFRATTQATLTDLNMTDRQFGWTVEMQVRALQQHKVVIEVPVSTRRRVGVSKISGTLRGVIGAANGILGSIFKLYWAGLGKRTLPIRIASRN